MLFCDLDGFKAVNDTFGHSAGDRLLIEVAVRLRRCVPDGDVVSRFGGDEFVMLCADAERRDAAQLCARIKSMLSEPFEVQGETITLGASIGFVAEEAVTDAEELIHRADAAMYAEDRYRAVAT